MNLSSVGDYGSNSQEKKSCRSRHSPCDYCDSLRNCDDGLLVDLRREFDRRNIRLIKVYPHFPLPGGAEICIGNSGDGGCYHFGTSVGLQLVAYAHQKISSAQVCSWLSLLIASAELFRGEVAEALQLPQNLFLKVHHL